MSGLHVILAHDGTRLTIDVDGGGGIPILDTDGTVLSLPLVAA